MSSDVLDWKPFYNQTQNRPADPCLEFVISRMPKSLKRTAIDCGCGAGCNTALLLSRGFEVYAFDADEAAINICNKRFAQDPAVHLRCDTFVTYNYPQVSLVLASFSLFFCPANEFEQAWQRIQSACAPGGIFYGTFLGTNDSWAKNNASSLDSPEVISHSAQEVKQLFSEFSIEALDERDFDGVTVAGVPKHWHTFSVIAKRN